MKLFQRHGEASQQPPVDAAAPPTAQRSWWWVVTAGAAAIALGIGLLVVDWQLARPLAVLILGITVAAALEPVVAFLQRRMARVVAILLIYVILAAIVAGIGVIAVPPLVRQVD